MREVNGTSLYYEQSGRGPETLFFSHGLLFDSSLWKDQVALFQERYSCLVYDHRGQGKSGREGGRDMDLLCEDAAALIRNLNPGPVHYIGLSMGGFVGLRLAARHPELLKSLILLNTSAEAEFNSTKYKLLNTTVDLFGIKVVSSRVMPIVYGASVLADPQRKAEVAAWRKRLNSLPKDVTKAVRGVIERQSVEKECAAIRCPTLIIAGEEDVATTPNKSRRLAGWIQGSRLEILPKTGHMSSQENPEAVNALIQEFIEAQSAQR